MESVGRSFRDMALAASLHAASSSWFGFAGPPAADRKSTRLNSRHGYISYAVFCLKNKIVGEPVAPAGSLRGQAFAGVWAIAAMTCINAAPAAIHPRDRRHLRRLLRRELVACGLRQ